MHRFDAAALKQQLETLPHPARVAFALACAERLATFSGEQLELAQAARAAAHQFLADTSARLTHAADLSAQLEVSPHLDRDDVAACAYVLDCLLTNDSQAPVWAAQRAYDARDLAAQNEMNFGVYTPEIESRLLGNPIVQAELAAQAADIAHLLKHPGSAPEIANRAVGGQHA